MPKSGCWVFYNTAWSLMSCLLSPPSPLSFPTGLIVYLGMMAGAFILGGLADKLGRKRVLSMSLALNASFASLSSFVQAYGAFLFCRLISGIGYVVSELQLDPPRPMAHPSWDSSAEWYLRKTPDWVFV